ncbi:unnamed protein product [Gemmataceae bacterium]|nr:unnamed protein product [Gemmataceae bacterium]VTT99810.1 unnamed protein product [Gemmataceae bacterium]
MEELLRARVRGLISTDAEWDFFAVFAWVPPERAVAWVETVAGPLAATLRPGWPQVYASPRGLVRVSRPPGDVVTVWFQRDGSWAGLWGDLGACALAASAGLGVPVYYHVGPEVVRAAGGQLVLVPAGELPGG